MTTLNLFRGNPKLTPEQKHNFQLSIIRGEGSIAFYAKKSIFDNPYKPGSEESENWLNAFIDSEKRANKNAN